MDKKVDVYVKDEGSISTVCFQTKKAIKIVTNQPKEIVDRLYGDDNYKKLDLDSGQEVNMLMWAITHKLTFGSDLPVTIKPLKK
jgi:uncharacterized membrane protein YjjP (DUF1212 family)